MVRSAQLNTDRSITWLTDLIEATEVVASSDEPCAPTIVKAFIEHLEMGLDRHLVDERPRA